MKKISLFHSLVYGNKSVVICVVFTLATLLDLILCVSIGIMDISYWHLGTRFLLCVLIILSLYIFKLFNNLPLYIMLAIHFVMAVLIMLAWVSITSLHREMHSNAYRDAVRTIVYIYPVIIVGSILLDWIRTAKVNRLLKKRLREIPDVE